MPTLLRQDGFEFRMYFNDHDPSHVHVFKAGTQAKISLGGIDENPLVILVQGMSQKDVKKAIKMSKKRSQ